MVFFSGSIFFLISLATYNNEDGGWTHSSTVQSVSNAGGVIGAWVADFCLSFFGVVAYLLPVVIIRHAYFAYISKQESRKKTLVILNWLGSFIAIISSAALFYLHVLRVGIELPGNSGGIIGQEIGDALLLMCGNSGATLLLIASFLAGITLATQLSWLTVIDLIGKYTVFLVDFIANTFAQLLQNYNTKPAATIKATVSQPEQEKTTKPVLRFIPDEAEPLKKPIPAKPVAQPIQLPPLMFDAGEQSISVKKTTDQTTKSVRPIASENKGEILPPLTLLDNRETRVKGYTQSDLEEMSRLVEDILADFNVSVEVVGFLPGPVITRFELQPAAGVKVSRISSLSKDLARALSVTSVRIVEVIPGKSVIGLEIPNREREMVNLRDLMASRAFEKAASLLTLAMGKDISGQPLVADLGKMPHALVAGTTGSGKSVAINSMILSLLYKATPRPSADDYDRS